MVKTLKDLIFEIEIEAFRFILIIIICFDFLFSKIEKSKFSYLL